MHRQQRSGTAEEDAAPSVARPSLGLMPPPISLMSSSACSNFGDASLAGSVAVPGDEYAFYRIWLQDEAARDPEIAAVLAQLEAQGLHSPLVQSPRVSRQLPPWEQAQEQEHCRASLGSTASSSSLQASSGHRQAEPNLREQIARHLAASHAAAAVGGALLLPATPSSPSSSSPRLAAGGSPRAAGQRQQAAAAARAGLSAVRTGGGRRSVDGNGSPGGGGGSSSSSPAPQPDFSRSQIKALRKLFPIRAPTPKPAAALQGEYQLLDVIGRGAFGCAYKARHLPTGRLVCIKALEAPPGEGRGDALRAQRREVAVLAALALHPNIIRYLECFAGQGLDAGKLHLVMEFADGGDLASLIERHHKARTYMSEDQLLGYFVQLVAALAHLHAVGIMHRDVKACNIFLTSQGLLQLGDFGISKVLDAPGNSNGGSRATSGAGGGGNGNGNGGGGGGSGGNSSSGASMGSLSYTRGMLLHSFVGTPNYLAPEAVACEGYGLKADIWAAGCVLFEMAALKPAFRGKHISVIYHLIRRGKTSPLPSVFSEGLQQLQRRMMARDPNLRPSSYELLHDELLRPHLARHRAVLQGLRLELPPLPMPRLTSHGSASGSLLTAAMLVGGGAPAHHTSRGSSDGSVASGHSSQRSRSSDEAPARLQWPPPCPGPAGPAQAKGSSRDGAEPPVHAAPSAGPETAAALPNTFAGALPSVRGGPAHLQQPQQHSVAAWRPTPGHPATPPAVAAAIAAATATATAAAAAEPGPPAAAIMRMASLGPEDGAAVSHVCARAEPPSPHVASLQSSCSGASSAVPASTGVDSLPSSSDSAGSHGHAAGSDSIGNSSASSSGSGARSAYASGPPGPALTGRRNLDTSRPAPLELLHTCHVAGGSEEHTPTAFGAEGDSAAAECTSAAASMPNMADWSAMQEVPVLQEVDSDGAHAPRSRKRSSSSGAAGLLRRLLAAAGLGPKQRQGSSRSQHRGSNGGGRGSDGGHSTRPTRNSGPRQEAPRHNSKGSRRLWRVAAKAATAKAAAAVMDGADGQAAAHGTIPAIHAGGHAPAAAAAVPQPFRPEDAAEKYYAGRSWSDLLREAGLNMADMDPACAHLLQQAGDVWQAASSGSSQRSSLDTASQRSSGESARHSGDSGGGGGRRSVEQQQQQLQQHAGATRLLSAAAWARFEAWQQQQQEQADEGQARLPQVPEAQPLPPGALQQHQPSDGPGRGAQPPSIHQALPLPAQASQGPSLAQVQQLVVMYAVRMQQAAALHAGHSSLSTISESSESLLTPRMGSSVSAVHSSRGPSIELPPAATGRPAASPSLARHSSFVADSSAAGGSSSSSSSSSATSSKASLRVGSPAKQVPARGEHAVGGADGAPDAAAPRAQPAAAGAAGPDAAQPEAAATGVAGDQRRPEQLQAPGEVAHDGDVAPEADAGLRAEQLVWMAALQRLKASMRIAEMGRRAAGGA